MPRIEIIPKDHTPPSPTIDVCSGCANGHTNLLEEGQEFDKDTSNTTNTIVNCIEADTGKDSPSYKVGSTDVEHPSYDDSYIECCICGEKLTKADDGGVV